MAFNQNSLTIPPGIVPSVPYPILNMVPVEAFGAVGDAYQIADGAINSGLVSLTSPGNHFVAFTGSKSIVVNNAGPIVNGLSTDLVTTGSFVSTGAITVANAAGATVSGSTVTIGTDNYTAIQAALNSTKAPNITIMNGLYLVSQALLWPSGKNIYGSGTPLNGSAFQTGIVGAGSLYYHQNNIVTDPLAGVGGTVVVASATQSGNTASYTLGSARPSQISLGSIITVSGMSPAGYNFTGVINGVGGTSFSMLVPTTGLGSSTVGGIGTSQSGKKYVAVAADGAPLTSTNTFNLNITACNPSTTIAWGALWGNVAANTGQWQYNFYNCVLIGYVGRHIMWCNGVTYSGCVMAGTWSGSAFTMPGGLTFTGVVQKVIDVGCIVSQEQSAFGRAHYEYNQTGTAGTFSAWSYNGGAIEGGYALGDFTGLNYCQNTVHYESFSAPAALFVNIPSTSTGTFISPDALITGGQFGQLASQGGSSGTTSWAWLQGGTIGVKQSSIGIANVATLEVATHTPSSHTDTGTTGTITWDGNFIYVCTATDAWTRVAIAAW